MIIIDDFVQDKRLLTKIALDNRFLTEGYHWWGGWWNETGEVIRPKIGTVFYFNPEVDNSEGGYLQLWDTYNSDATNLPYELIRPKFNRLVIFDAGKLHAVQEVTKGIRHAVAINLWSQAPADVANMLK